MKLAIDIEKLLRPIKARLPEIIRLKDELREKLRKERQCVAVTRQGARCQAWSVVGNPLKTCYRHGGADAAKIPKKERFPACRCPAYNFPHHRRSGLCSGLEKPFGIHPSPPGQRRYGKRKRKTQIKKWLNGLGM